MQDEISGYGAQAARRQRALERRIIESARADAVAESSQALAARPHVAGTEGQARTRDYVLERMRAWGLQTSVAEYEIYLPHPVSIALERLTPAPQRFNLREPVLAGSAGSADPTMWPAWNGYAAAGDVRAALVYVNYACEEDLERLTALGVSLEGKIALARYGEIFRGIKIMNVQRRGAIGCILYSDPYDDGYFRGDVFPDGPMRPAGGLQRGSVNCGVGDPTAPGVASLPGVKRVAPHEAAALPRIPSLPVGHAIAEELLRHLSGPEVPQEWQGALPFRYHVGPGPVAVRLKIEHDGGHRRIWNTFGRIDGCEWPDEWIIIGGHRDAWGCGAVDNVSGIASLMEAARLCAELARGGEPPRRTLIFATWDAEEWGLIGSTEWVEEQRDTLARSAVAYINQDITASGPDFGASASPSLAAVLRDITRTMPSPDQAGQTVYQTWLAHQAAETGDKARGPLDAQTPRVGHPGGGSDHEGFFLHLGIPAAGHGFYGRGGVYHSAYDGLEWLERFADPGYRRHRAAAALTAALALRLANADALPLDYVAYGAAIETALAELRGRATASDTLRGVALDPLHDTLRAFQAAAAGVAARVQTVDWAAVAPAQCCAFNDALRQVERTLTRPADAPPDPDAGAFLRNLVFGVNPCSGYGGWVLPGLTGAVRAQDAARLDQEARLLAHQLAAATEHLRRALAATR